MFFFIIITAGTLPTTVLGQVQSPDVDDWSEKVYKFEDRPPRYFNIFYWYVVVAADTQSDERKAERENVENVLYNIGGF